MSSLTGTFIFLFSISLQSRCFFEPRIYLIETVDKTDSSQNVFDYSDTSKSSAVVDVSGWDKGCGRAAQKVSVRISGGKEATPHSWPWVARIEGGSCAGGGLCGATLISKRVIVYAYHCTGNQKNKPCDHSDGKRVAQFGRHGNNTKDVIRIPIIDTKYPPGAPLDKNDNESHDFTIGILQHDVEFSDKVRPICLPKQNTMNKDLKATAIGWGLYASSNISQDAAENLQEVDLEIRPNDYKHSKMFGTLVKKNEKGIYMDPCAGDSGGPLMQKDPVSDQWVIIGTVSGNGYDCRTNKLQYFEGEKGFGLWNKVAAFTDWIKKTIESI